MLENKPQTLAILSNAPGCNMVCATSYAWGHTEQWSPTPLQEKQRTDYTNTCKNCASAELQCHQSQRYRACCGCRHDAASLQLKRRVVGYARRKAEGSVAGRGNPTLDAHRPVQSEGLLFFARPELKHPTGDWAANVEHRCAYTSNSHVYVARSPDGEHACTHPALYYTMRIY